VTADARHWERWLRAYPRGWRERNGTVLLGTALDVADAAGRDRPTRREIADLVSHGLAVRAGLLLPSPAVLRSAAVAAVILGGTLALTALILGELVPPYRQNPELALLIAEAWGPFTTTGPVLYGLWVSALAALALGRQRWARALLALCAVTAAALIPVAAAFEVNRPPRALLLALFWCALVGATGLRGAPRATAAGALAGAAGLTTAATLASGGPPVLLPAALESTWADLYETMPFYGGTAGAVSGTLLMVAVLVAAAGAVIARRPHLVLAFLFVAPGALPWDVDEPGFRWASEAASTDQLWRSLALALPVLVIAADRLLRRRGSVLADGVRG
jgi:hypothetical protein